MEDVVWPLLQEYVYEGVPPLACAVAVPLVPSLHEGVVVTFTLIAREALTLATAVAVQPFASVTVTV